MHTRLPAVLAVVAVLAAGLVTPAAAIADEASPPVPTDAVAFDGHHYLLVDEVEELSWDLARARCEDLGAMLVVVTTAEEAEFVARLCGGRYMYLGATDRETEGEWVWVDGSTWDFTFWMDGQPNDYGGSEDFLATYGKGRWVDVDGSGDDFWMPTGFICEWAH